MEDSDLQENLGIDRRTLLKRGAIVGGTLVWAAPVVQTLARPAFAAGSVCRGTVTVGTPGQPGCVIIAYLVYSQDCCICATDPTDSACTLTCLSSATLVPASQPFPSCA